MNTKINVFTYYEDVDFSLRLKKSRVGRNPKTKEKKIISKRNVVLFKASKEFKKFVNTKNNE